LTDVFGSEVFALLAAICFAGSQVSVRRGLVQTPIISGVLISLFTALVVIGLSVAIDPPDQFDALGIGLFALAGLAAPGVSRWAATTGVHRLGPSIAVPITQGTRPLLAVAGALLFLGEAMTLQKLVGLLAIVAGGWELSRSRKDARSLQLGSLEGSVVEEASLTQRLFRLRPGIAFPLLAGLSYAASDLVVKEALSHQEKPRFGAMVGMASALLIWSIFAFSTPPLRRQLHVGNDFWWLILSGMLAGLAIISLFTALNLGDVTVVSPITASQPLAVFVFSRLLLRDLERLHASTVLAGCSIVVGTIVIST
jgi:DME family drug/metabolite transporter